MLCRPARRSVLAVVPEHRKIRQSRSRCLAGHNLPRNGQNGFGRLREHACQRRVDTPLQLPRGRPCRHSEIERFHFSRCEQSGKAPQCRLRLACAGLGLEQDEVFTGWHTSDRLLRWPWFRVIGDNGPARCAAQRKSVGGETDFMQPPISTLPCRVPIVGSEHGLEWKGTPVRTDPVRQREKATEEVHERWRSRRRRGRRDGGKPVEHRPAKQSFFGFPVIAGHFEKGTGGGALPGVVNGTAMVGKRRMKPDANVRPSRQENCRSRKRTRI
ncbi:hypothetical protein A6302_04439 [Methylobrevis pamukkalensis]|uniref:Uncharacterized protein n=1 Tax=Methylobrevis pamukkalensis TaxID=1439726 RepID=A0A1E3GRA6_9HYPH|nr:hypothetical protein A6302_04439 [Methylobrevis pamukkalensis]